MKYKKIPGLLSYSRTKEKINFINTYKGVHRIGLMCEVLEISPKTYYKYRNVPDKDYEDYKLIRRIFNQSMKTYGYRRITDELREKYGVIYNAKKVLRIMNKYGIQPLYIKNQQRNGHKVRMERMIRPDLQSKKIIGYQISQRNDNKLVLDTLHKAFKKIKDPSGLVLHSDQGFQYISTEYQTVCESRGILISMSRKGTPLDNTVIESFHSLL